MMQHESSESWSVISRSSRRWRHTGSTDGAGQKLTPETRDTLPCWTERVKSSYSPCARSALLSSDEICVISSLDMALPADETAAQWCTMWPTLKIQLYLITCPCTQQWTCTCFGAVASAAGQSQAGVVGRSAGIVHGPKLLPVLSADGLVRSF